MTSPQQTVFVAFATKDGEHVDQHFGSARRFVIYELSAMARTEKGDREFKKEAQDGNEDKLIDKLAWLTAETVDVLVCSQVGQSAVTQLLKAGVQPIAVEGKPRMEDVLDRLQTDMQGPDVSWLKRLKKTKRPEGETLDALLEEEWQG